MWPSVEHAVHFYWSSLVTFLSPHVPSGQLTWLVYMIGSAIGGRVSFNTSDDHDAMDGELVCR